MRRLLSSLAATVAVTATLLTPQVAFAGATDGTAPGGSSIPPGSGSGTSQPKCKGDKQGFQLSDGFHTVVPVSPLCADGLGGWSIDYGGRYLVTTGYEVWRFYQNGTGKDSDVIAWSRSRINLGRWVPGERNTPRFVAAAPLPRDLGNDVPSIGERSSTGGGWAPGYMVANQKESVRKGNSDDYYTDVLLSDDAEDQTGANALAKMQLTAVNDPIVKLLTQTNGAYTQADVRKAFRPTFLEWKQDFGAPLAGRMLNIPVDPDGSMGDYRTSNPAGDPYQMASSLDFGASGEAPRYGLCYLPIQAFVQRYTRGNEHTYGVITDGSLLSTAASSAGKDGERYYDNANGNGGFWKWRNIIKADTSDSYTRPLKTDKDYVYGDHGPKSNAREKSAQFAGNRATCIPGWGTKTSGSGLSTPSRNYPVDPSVAVSSPEFVVARGLTTQATVNTRLTYPATTPDGKPAAPTRPDSSWVQYSVTVPGTLRYCAAGSTQGCDFTFDSGVQVVNQSGNTFTVRSPIPAAAPGSIVDSAVSLKFFRATPPGLKVEAVITEVHSEFDITSTYPGETIRVCSPNQIWGDGEQAVESMCADLMQAVSTSVASVETRSVYPNAKTSFTVIIATPLSSLTGQDTEVKPAPEVTYSVCGKLTYHELIGADKIIKQDRGAGALRGWALSTYGSCARTAQATIPPQMPATPAQMVTDPAKYSREQWHVACQKASMWLVNNGGLNPRLADMWADATYTLLKRPECVAAPVHTA